MKTEQIALSPLAPGANLSLTLHRFGREGARPRVYVQAALHADEIPGMIVAHHLREQLRALEAEGRIEGEIVLVPSANPIGLAQKVLAVPVGRFDLATGTNFNRGYPNVIEAVAARIEATLTGEADTNVRLIREALLAELSAIKPENATDVLKKTLLELAIDADYVLDMHCDAEAAVHLYTHTLSSDELAPLAAFLGARAVLVADVSGDDPFDEACSRPWAELAAKFPDRPIPMACHATTLEFRGEMDVADELAGPDAARPGGVSHSSGRDRRKAARRPSGSLRRNTAGWLRAGGGARIRHGDFPPQCRRGGQKGRCGGRYRRSADRRHAAGACGDRRRDVRAHSASVRNSRETDRQGGGPDQHPDG